MNFIVIAGSVRGDLELVSDRTHFAFGSLQKMFIEIEDEEYVMQFFNIQKLMKDI